MKHFSRIKSLILISLKLPLGLVVLCYVFVLIFTSCSQKHKADPKGECPGISNIFSLTKSSDGMRIYMGTKGNAFYEYDPLYYTLQRYKLPVDTVMTTYCVYDIGDEQFLVGLRNKGLMYLDYRGDNTRENPRYKQFKSPTDTIPPIKGINYSVYHMNIVGDTCVLATSNGLMYATKSDLVAAPQDGIFSGLDELNYVQPIKHLRDLTKQFSQECLFRINDTILTVTDRGIYAIAVGDFDNPSKNAVQKIDSTHRFFSAILNQDTLRALSLDSQNRKNRLIHTFIKSGRDFKFRSADTIDASTIGLAVYNRRQVKLGPDSSKAPQGDFQCVNSWVSFFPYFYYIEDGHLMVSNMLKENSSINDEIIEHDCGSYVISNKNGIWRKHDYGFDFVGDILASNDIESATYSEFCDKIFMVIDGRLYFVSTTKYLLPSNRKPEMVLEQLYDNMDPEDRIEEFGRAKTGYSLVYVII